MRWQAHANSTAADCQPFRWGGSHVGRAEGATRARKSRETTKGKSVSVRAQSLWHKGFCI